MALNLSTKSSRKYEGVDNTRIQAKHVPFLLTKRDWIVYKWVIGFLQNKEKLP